MALDQNYRTGGNQNGLYKMALDEKDHYNKS